MACPSVTTLFVATGYRSLWYSETCIKQLLNFVVSQDRWSQWQGEYTWFCKDWPDECWNLCVFSKTIPVLFYRFRCIKSFRSTQKHICWRSGTRGTRASTDTTVVDSVFRIHGYYYISLNQTTPDVSIYWVDIREKLKIFFHQQYMRHVITVSTL